MTENNAHREHKPKNGSEKTEEKNTQTKVHP
jgi:hypothetical protein